MKHNNRGNTSVFWLVAFVLIFALGIFMVHFTNVQRKERVAVVADVVDIVRERNSNYKPTRKNSIKYFYKTLLSYSHDGKRYSTTYDGTNALMLEGKTIKLYIDPNNPEDYVLGSYIVPIIVCVIGGGGILIGGWKVITSTTKYRKKQYEKYFAIHDDSCN